MLTIASPPRHAIGALLVIAVLAMGLVGLASRSTWTSVSAVSSSARFAPPGPGHQEQAGTANRGTEDAGLGVPDDMSSSAAFAAIGGAIHPNRAERNSRIDAGSPSEADTFLLAALERLEQQVAAAMVRVRESVVALEYTAADAPTGTRRIATGVVINQRGDVLSVKIDPLVSGKPAGTHNDQAPILARDYLGRRHIAHRIAADLETGLTLLQIAPRAVRAIRIATGQPHLGGQIFVLGNPFGMGQSVSRGHIAGLDGAMELADRQLSGMIQVQAPLYPGDSGAAVVNVRGELLGLIRSGWAIPRSHSVIRSRPSRRGPDRAPNSPAGQLVSWPSASAAVSRLDEAEQDNDFGFAISAGDALWVADQLRAYGRVDRAYLGVRLEESANDLPTASFQAATSPERVFTERQDLVPKTALGPASDQRAESHEGAVLAEVLAGTPAAGSGLSAGDRIVSVDGRPIQSAHDLTDRLDRIPARTTIQIGVIRGLGRRQERIFLSLRTASRPTQQQLAQLDRARSEPAPALTGTSTPITPVTITAASATSTPAARATTHTSHGAPARSASLASSTPAENARLVDRSAAPAPELRPNDLRLTLPRAVVERLEQLERRLEKLESSSPKR